MKYIHRVILILLVCLIKRIVRNHPLRRLRVPNRTEEGSKSCYEADIVKTELIVSKIDPIDLPNVKKECVGSV